MRIVIALGGNALGQTPSEQIKNATLAAKPIAKMIAKGYEVVITHGNGPQVGLINLAFTEGNKLNDKVYMMPFPECNAMSEGYIGYHLQNCIKNELSLLDYNATICSINTQIEVDINDPAFDNPTKPIGGFYTKEEADKLPFTMKEDAGRGFRRVVASPLPKKIVELDAIKSLAEKGIITICCGGGGIPVVNKDNKLVGVDAVIDKDFASALLAKDINADILMIITAVPNAILNFGKENEIILNKVSLKDIIKYNEEGHFKAGSMKPKVEACINFVSENKSGIAIITSIEEALNAIDNNAGTIIYNED